MSDVLKPGSVVGCLGTGKAGHPLYHTWRGMILRCELSSHIGFARYGARGVKVATRWRHDFGAFVADMGDRPAGHTLDRRDPRGDYKPGNCRWVPSVENTRRGRSVRVGLHSSLVRASASLRLSAGAVSMRRRLGWCAHHAGTLAKHRSPPRSCPDCNRSGRVSRPEPQGQIGARLGLTQAAVSYRLRYGWCASCAYSLPKGSRRPSLCKSCTSAASGRIIKRRLSG